MKKMLLILVSLAMVCVAAEAAKPKKAMKNFRAVPMEKAQLLQEGKGKAYCSVCGMTLPMFYKTNHAAKVNGKTHQYCSIHCMIEEAMTNGKEVVDAKVVETNTLKFITSQDAFYVVGSKKPGTMSPVSKYAFGTKETAEKFAEKFGGKVMSYAETSKIVKGGMKKAIGMIKKRQAKAAKMGEKVYKKMCKQTDKRFANAAEAKSYLKEHKLCGKLKGKPFQQVGLFLAGKGNK
ncbi:MAG TPA: hypothetical protein EYG83_09640 [Sulfurospirillum arcachonense]|nr:hypothetical protein [Sulfurospirillum arcachonense]